MFKLKIADYTFYYKLLVILPTTPENHATFFSHLYGYSSTVTVIFTDNKLQLS